MVRLLSASRSSSVVRNPASRSRTATGSPFPASASSTALQEVTPHHQRRHQPHKQLHLHGQHHLKQRHIRGMLSPPPPPSPPRRLQRRSRERHHPESAYTRVSILGRGAHHPAVQQTIGECDSKKQTKPDDTRKSNPTRLLPNSLLMSISTTGP